MVDSKKNLTVSYGSFSCTFEGFDDPFVAVSAISGFVHDLDQQPCATHSPPSGSHARALAEIVERASKAAVDARFENGVYTLRALRSDSQTTPLADQSDDTQHIRNDDRTTRGTAPSRLSGNAPASLDLAEFAISPKKTASPQAPTGQDTPAGSASLPASDRVAARPDTHTDFSAQKHDRRISGLTPEQEAELARELAEVVAILKDDFNNGATDGTRAAAPPPGDTPKGPAEHSDGRAAATNDAAGEHSAGTDRQKAEKTSRQSRFLLPENLIGEGDRSVDRILQETNTQFGAPGADRRRSAFAHLRAAVDATRADRILRRKSDVDISADPYRADLANAVHPRGPSSVSAMVAKASPRDPHPAPLTLVAAQRVDGRHSQRDGDSAAPTAETSDVQDATASRNGFAKYANDTGARTLSERLEAAAAYLSFVEGHAQFSRPQLMIKVSAVEATPSSREDRLQTFAQLLRDGRILKTQDGRFSASEQIRFKPGNRAVG